MARPSKEEFSAFVVVCIALMSFAGSVTNEEEVYALNVLYSSLGKPSSLLGWTADHGDPCSGNWTGVICVGPNVTELNLSGLSLTGVLGYAMDKLSSLMILNVNHKNNRGKIQSWSSECVVDCLSGLKSLPATAVLFFMDLSNNELTGTIPYQLPSNIQKLILSSNQLSGNLPYSFRDMIELIFLNVSNNNLSGSIPDVFQKSVFLTHIDLSDNNITGTIPPSFRNLTNLNTLHIQNNNIDGTIDALSGLPLKDLDLSNNDFIGDIPETLRSLPSVGFSGNHFDIPIFPFVSPVPSPASLPSVSPTASHPSVSPTPPAAFATLPSDSSQIMARDDANGSKRSLPAGSIAGIVVAFLLTFGFALLTFLFFRWRPKEHTQEEQAEITLKLKYSPVPDISTMTPKEKLGDEEFLKSVGSTTAIVFTIEELQIATSNFNQDNLLGEGTSGRVYKGKFSNGKILAVKKLDSSLSIMHEKDFLEVITGLSRLRHANINELVGYCVEFGQHILVYDYVSNGTLHEALHSGEEKSVRLSWNIRIKIALGAARALEYLHEVCQPMVIHRNFKSSNVLLDKDFNPYVSDCGLLPLTSLGTHYQFSDHHVGSFGYSAPEFAMSGKYSTKCDIYSFGIMMLELLTGRKPLDSSKSRLEQSLVRWARPQLNDIDSLSKMVDPALRGMYPAKSLFQFADIISQCVQPEPEFRPSMSEVVQSLVRLLQRANVTKRSSGDELGYSQRVYQIQELNDL